MQTLATSSNRSEGLRAAIISTMQSDCSAGFELNNPATHVVSVALG